MGISTRYFIFAPNFCTHNGYKRTKITKNGSKCSTSQQVPPVTHIPSGGWGHPVNYGHPENFTGSGFSALRVTVLRRSG